MFGAVLNFRNYLTGLGGKLQASLGLGFAAVDQPYRALGQLLESYSHKGVLARGFALVEGAGGLYVPLVATHFLVVDMIRWLHLPLMVVARPGLGTINHTVLTVKAAQQAGGLPEHPIKALVEQRRG